MSDDLLSDIHTLDLGCADDISTLGEPFPITMHTANDSASGRAAKTAPSKRLLRSGGKSAGHIPDFQDDEDEDEDDDDKSSVLTSLEQDNTTPVAAAAVTRGKSIRLIQAARKRQNASSMSPPASKKKKGASPQLKTLFKAGPSKKASIAKTAEKLVKISDTFIVKKTGGKPNSPPPKTNAKVVAPKHVQKLASIEPRDLKFKRGATIALLYNACTDFWGSEREAAASWHVAVVEKVEREKSDNNSNNGKRGKGLPAAQTVKYVAWDGTVDTCVVPDKDVVILQEGDEKDGTGDMLFWPDGTLFGEYNPKQLFHGDLVYSLYQCGREEKRRFRGRVTEVEEIRLRQHDKPEPVCSVAYDDGDYEVNIPYQRYRFVFKIYRNEQNGHVDDWMKGLSVTIAGRTGQIINTQKARAAHLERTIPVKFLSTRGREMIEEVPFVTVLSNLLRARREEKNISILSWPFAFENEPHGDRQPFYTQNMSTDEAQQSDDDNSSSVVGLPKETNVASLVSNDTGASVASSLAQSSVSSRRNLRASTISKTTAAINNANKPKPKSKKELEALQRQQEQKRANAETAIAETTEDDYTNLVSSDYLDVHDDISGNDKQSLEEVIEMNFAVCDPLIQTVVSSDTWFGATILNSRLARRPTTNDESHTYLLYNKPATIAKLSELIVILLHGPKDESGTLYPDYYKVQFVSDYVNQLIHTRRGNAEDSGRVIAALPDNYWNRSVACLRTCHYVEDKETVEWTNVATSNLGLSMHLHLRCAELMYHVLSRQLHDADGMSKDKVREAVKERAVLQEIERQGRGCKAACEEYIRLFVEFWVVYGFRNVDYFGHYNTDKLSKDIVANIMGARCTFTLLTKRHGQVCRILLWIYSMYSYEDTENVARFVSSVITDQMQSKINDTTVGPIPEPTKQLIKLEIVLAMATVDAEEQQSFRLAGLVPKVVKLMHLEELYNVLYDGCETEESTDE